MATSNTPSFQAPQVAPNSSMAITSMILGILGWTFLPLIGAVVAIITGHMAKNEIKNSRGGLAGDGMATTGLVLGYAQLALGLCICAIALLFPAAFYWIWNNL